MFFIFTVIKMNYLAMKKLLFILFPLICFSQNETNNWVFGKNSIVNFNSFTPNTLFTSGMNSENSVSCISDHQGNLVLYTNGFTLWNKNHLIVKDGIAFYGEILVPQSSIIVPDPGNTNVYYIFTAKSVVSAFPPGVPEPPILPGLYYSKIDISLNGGQGGIVEKNIKIHDQPSAKLTAVHHSDGKSIWVAITSKEKDTDTEFSFLTYKVTETGVDSTPIVSSTKLYTGGIEGTMKFSPDGKRIIVSNIGGQLATFDFDASTGALSNWLPLLTTKIFFNNVYVNSLAFSNDSNFLYTITVDLDSNETLINQYDLLNSNPEEKIVTIHREGFKGKSSLQLAIDGKIYKTQTDGISNGNNLDVITKPNKLGNESNFIKNQVLMTDRVKQYFPNFIQSYFRTRILNEKGCVNQPIDFEVDTYAPITAASWDFGDGNTSNDISPSYAFSSAGTFNVKVTITVNNRQITTAKDIVIHPNPILIPNQKLVQCDVNNDGIDYFNLNTITDKISQPNSDLTFYFYETQTDAEQDTNKILTPESYQNKMNPQIIYVRAVNKNDCYTIENFTIESSFVNIPAIAPMIVCEDSDGIVNNNEGQFDIKTKKEDIRNQLGLSSSLNLDLYPTLIDAQTTTNKFDDIITSSSTTAWLRIDNAIGCGGIKSIDLIVNSTPQINLQDEYTLCVDPKKHPPITLTADTTNDKFEWKDANNNILSTNQTYTLDRVGQFTLTVYKTENGIECSNSKDFTVVNPKKPIIKNLEINTENNLNNFVSIEIEGTSTYEYSLDGINYLGNSINYTFNNVTPGIKTIYIRDFNSCEPSIQREISIIGFPKFLTPNSDGKNDVWLVYGATSNFFKTIDITIFNRFGKVLYRMNNNNAQLGWEGTFNGKILPSDGYWYKAKLIDHKDKVIEKTGNISLMRK